MLLLVIIFENISRANLGIKIATRFTFFRRLLSLLNRPTFENTPLENNHSPFLLIVTSTALQKNNIVDLS